MGQEQNKYHVTDDGKIFSVMNDGSVSEIGNVSALFDNNKTVEKTTQPKSRKWMWTAIISWIVLIVACITFLVQYDEANSYIRSLHNRNDDLAQNLSQAKSELRTKTAELDSITQQIYREKQNRMPITVTGVNFANVNQNESFIDSYGTPLYSNRLCFLRPKISYTGRKSGSYNFTTKFIRPDGTEVVTDKFQVYSAPGKSGNKEMQGWGWSTPGNYEVGRWSYQIWYDDILVYSTTFDIL